MIWEVYKYYVSTANKNGGWHIMPFKPYAKTKDIALKYAHSYYRESMLHVKKAGTQCLRTRRKHTRIRPT